MKLFQRDFTDPILLPGIEFDPLRYSWNAIGGPKQAKVRAIGGSNSIWSLLNILRMPAEIFAPDGTKVWWGYVAQAKIKFGSITLSVSLDEMFNKIAVTYNELEPGSTGIGSRGTTAYSINQPSDDVFGTKQIMIAMADMNSDGAIQARDRFLERLKIPIANIDPKMLSGEMEVGELTLRGWYDTLDWIYYNRSAGREAFEVWDANQAVGALSTNSRVKTTFQIGASEGWDASTAAVRLSAEDTGELIDLTIELWDDSGGLPNTQLATGTIDHTLLPALPTFEWFTADWTTMPTLLVATTYHFIVDSHGPFTNDELAVQVDEGLGYAAGAFSLWNGTNWLTRSPDADLAFRISGVEETTLQMEKIFDVCGQFLTSFALETNAAGTKQDSNIFISQFREGDNPGLIELLDLLATGKENGQRYLAKVTDQRVLEVSQEPLPANADHRLLPSADIMKGTQLVRRSLCPVGMWVKTIPVTSAAVRTAVMDSVDPIFIEETEYDVKRDRLRFEARDKPRTWDITGIRRIGR